MALVAALVVAGCGGGAESPVSSAAPDSVGTAVFATSTTLSGSVVKGPVDGATVCAYVLLPAGKGDKLACTTTRADGSYDLQLAYTGPVLVEATGGTYTDEATGTPNVPLAEALRAVGTAVQGGAAVVPTPLTELAVRKALANGGLSDDTFKAAAAEVAAAFGIGAGVDLAGTLPAVSGQVNTYGSALIGVSRMLAKGATLSGILSNANLAALQAGYQKATSSACNQPSAQQLVSVPATGIDFTIVGPQAAWRSLLPGAGGSAMGCGVTANAAQEVKLSCPSSALTALAIATSDKASTVAMLPGTGVLIVGDGIAAGDVAATAGSIVFTDAAGAAIPSTATLVLDTNGSVNLGNGFSAGGNGLFGGTPAVPIGGTQLQLCTLSANGGTIVTGLGTLTTSGGSITNGGGNLTLGATGNGAATGGNVVTGATTVTGGTLVVSGGSVTTASGTSSGGTVTVSPGN